MLARAILLSTLAAGSAFAAEPHRSETVAVGVAAQVAVDSRGSGDLRAGITARRVDVSGVLGVNAEAAAAGLAGTDGGGVTGGARLQLLAVPFASWACSPALGAGSRLSGGTLRASGEGGLEGWIGGHAGGLCRLGRDVTLILAGKAEVGAGAWSGTGFRDGRRFGGEATLAVRDSFAHVEYTRGEGRFRLPDDSVLRAPGEERLGLRLSVRVPGTGLFLEPWASGTYFKRVAPDGAGGPPKAAGEAGFAFGGAL